MYSLQGLLALIFPSSGQVCHSLIVESYWIPGSAEDQAALAALSHSSRAGTDLYVFPSVRFFRSHSRSSLTALMQSLGTRTELFEFCPPTVRYASLRKSVSYV